MSDLSVPQQFTIVSPQCQGCKHLKLPAGSPPLCTAYPELPGIPVEIWANSVDHTKPYPGDHGITWEPK